MTTCIDLRELAGKRYRLGHDPAYFAEHGEGGRAEDLWLIILPGARGHIYPHSDKLLAVATNGRGPTAKAIAALPGVTVEQDGDDGINATFPPELFPQIARLIKLRTRRQISEAERARLAGMSAQHGFKGSKAISDDCRSPQNRVPMGMVDTSDVAAVERF